MLWVKDGSFLVTTTILAAPMLASVAPMVEALAMVSSSTSWEMVVDVTEEPEILPVALRVSFFLPRSSWYTRKVWEMARVSLL